MIPWLSILLACPPPRVCLTLADAHATSVRIHLSHGEVCEKGTAPIKTVSVTDTADGSLLWAMRSSRPSDLSALTYGVAPDGYVVEVPARPLVPGMTVAIRVWGSEGDAEIEVTTL